MYLWLRQNGHCDVMRFLATLISALDSEEERRVCSSPLVFSQPRQKVGRTLLFLPITAFLSNLHICSLDIASCAVCLWSFDDRKSVICCKQCKIVLKVTENLTIVEGSHCKPCPVNSVFRCNYFFVKLWRKMKHLRVICNDWIGYHGDAWWKPSRHVITTMTSLLLMT